MLGQKNVLSISGRSAVGEQDTKQLITVFGEAMSHVASKARRAYRADAVRHKSGRGGAVLSLSGCINHNFQRFFRGVAQLVARVLWEQDTDYAYSEKQNR